MNLQIIPIVIILFFFTSCNESKNQEKSKPSEKEIITINFVKTFEGEISNKYPIIAKIKSNTGEIEGNYYYTKVGQELELQGTISNEGELNLKEFDDKGNQTGQFEGIYSRGKIEGNWSKPNGDKIMPFQLLESNTDYSSIKKELQELKGISGRYESTFNEGGTSSGTVVINQKKGQEFTFEIIVANSKGCTGDLKGSIKVGTNKVGFFKSKTCKELMFEFFSQEVKVQEKNCDEHGMNCWFAGTYKKKI